MGIFSLFGKKNRPAPAQEARKPASANSGSTVTPAQQAQLEAQRNLGLSTVMKIDEIESEMARDMFREADSRKRAERQAEAPELTIQLSTSPNSKRMEAAKPAPDFSDEPPLLDDYPEGIPNSNFMATVPLAELSTDDLFEANASEGMVAQSASALDPTLEEAAVLFANGQTAPVEQLLQHAIAENKDASAPRTAWWMLFDLYQITKQNFAFDSLSIDYANQFETSPPAWNTSFDAAPSKPAVQAGVTPTIAFAGTLDESINKQLERIQKLASKTQVFRLEFARVAQVTPEGCRLLLAAFKSLQKSERELILVGAGEFAEKIRASIQIGRRDETEAPWLLLLEILQLLNREKEFEEISMDYCVTFEVSPPSFEATRTAKVSTAPVEDAQPVTDDRFMMPPLLQGEINELLQSLNEYASERQAVIIDCSRLARIDFTAASLLLNGLTPLTAADKTIEFLEVNHLVVALFHVLGLDQIAQVTPHKY